ncbi:MAG: hypothetical protein ACKVXR_14575 [Planctomycetota bacterium]
MKKTKKWGVGNRARRGAALVASVVVLVVLMGMAGTVMALGLASHREHRGAEDDLKAAYLAEAGISDKISQLIANNAADIGTATNQRNFAGGQYWVDLTTLDATNRIYSLLSRASYGGDREAIEAVVRAVTNPLGNNAVFAGNSSNTAGYTLPFGGTGTSADRINGDVYSGGNVTVTGGALISGTIRAKGTITGAGGTPGVVQPAPDFASQNYPVNNNYNVNNLFATATSVTNSSLGGTAWQMPESSPVHIFRRNPSDRTSLTNATTGDDFFLEDPYEPVRTDITGDGSDATMITLSGVGGEPGVNSNRKVFYIRGNLWVHNLNTLSFKLNSPGTAGVGVTIAVMGNIYIGDSIYYGNASKDGVALIAIKDPTRPTTTGNTYFGDPTFGTVRKMQAFMYAENNFYDNNLNQSGSSNVTIDGNVVAGNQVLVNRDYGSTHTKLTVNYDGRLVSGSITLPGIPSQTSPITAYTVLSWRQIGAN